MTTWYVQWQTCFTCQESWRKKSTHLFCTLTNAIMPIRFSVDGASFAVGRIVHWKQSVAKHRRVSSQQTIAPDTQNSFMYANCNKKEARIQFFEKALSERIVVGKVGSIDALFCEQYFKFCDNGYFVTVTGKVRIEGHWNVQSTWSDLVYTAIWPAPALSLPRSRLSPIVKL